MTNRDFTFKLISFNFHFDSEDTKELQFTDFQNVEAFLKESSFEEYQIKHERLCIKKNDLPFVYFENVNGFVNQIKDKELDKPILINNYKKELQFLYFEKNETYINNVRSDINFLVKNALAVKEIKLLFSDLSNGNKYDIEIVDNYSLSNQVVTFISLKDRTKVNLELKPTGTLILDENIDYYSKIVNLKEYLLQEKKQFSVFLKNSIISNLVYEETRKFELFFEKFDKIFHEAKLNFNVFLHELSLDKIKSDYKEYKQKYFASQNEILSKLTTQVIALPVSLAASAFSLYKLKGEFFLILILYFGLISYVVYITFILTIYFKDVVSLNKLAQRDFNTLKNHLFFINNKEELDYFEEIKNDLFNRLKNLKNGLRIFTIIIWGSSTALFYYGLETFSINIGHKIIPLIITISIYSYIYLNFLDKDKLLNK